MPLWIDPMCVGSTRCTNSRKSVCANAPLSVCLECRYIIFMYILVSSFSDAPLALSLSLCHSSVSEHTASVTRQPRLAAHLSYYIGNAERRPHICEKISQHTLLLRQGAGNFCLPFCFAAHIFTATASCYRQTK